MPCSDFSLFWRSVCRLLCVLLLLALCPFSASSAEAPPQQKTPPQQTPSPKKWEQLEAGAELGHFIHLREQSHDYLPPVLELVVVRLNPAYFDFALISASEKGEAPKSLEEWALTEPFAAAINASMFLPDGLTSTGHLRNTRHVNNPRIVGRFGAFFLADPVDPLLPRAQLIDRNHDDWQRLVPLYREVVQNYRLISADSRVLWASGGPEYAVAAVGADRAGNIVFIHCREPVPGEYLGKVLLELPLDLRMAMYVEGGSHAALMVRMGAVNRVWQGRKAADFLSNGLNTPLPNLLVARRRAVCP